MKLDTLLSIEVIRRMYKGLGFVRIEAYYDMPAYGTVSLGLDLLTVYSKQHLVQPAWPIDLRLSLASELRR